MKIQGVPRNMTFLSVFFRIILFSLKQLNKLLKKTFKTIYKLGHPDFKEILIDSKRINY